MGEILNFKDKPKMIARLVQVVFGAVFLGVIVTVAPIKEAGIIAIPAILIPLILIIDGILRFLVIKNGITLDLMKKTLTYPKSYKMKTLELLEITAASPTSEIHTGAKAGTSTRSFNIELKGHFGNEKIIFASKKIRDEVYDNLKEYINKK